MHGEIGENAIFTMDKREFPVGHGGSFTAEVSDSERLRTPKVQLGLFPYVY